MIHRLGLALIFTTAVWGQNISYEVSFDNRVHHEAQVRATFSMLPRQPLEIHMSRSSPGRYAIHDFAKNVYAVKATDSKGRELAVEQADPSSWRIADHDGTVNFSYVVFGDLLDGTYNAFSNTLAHMNMPATFAWARGLDKQPIRVTFKIPEKNWSIATQLIPGKEPNSFTAPDLQYFMDSPVSISDLTMREWTVDNRGKTSKFVSALHHLGSSEEADAFAKVCQAIVTEEQAVFGELAEYDHGSYTFLFDLVPYAEGDGMEHRNSTVITVSDSLRGGIAEIANSVSHEFFHSWNVERMRPRALEPFDFDRANMSSELWFAEGFTDYYDDLILKRASVISIDRYAKSLSRMLSTVINAPGRKMNGPAGMSRQAPFVDAATAVDPNNRRNTFLSYYTYGAATGLGLDLILRTQKNKTLDGYMRAVWEKHGKTEIPYTMEDLRMILGTFTGDQKFADDFFKRYVVGAELVDYEKLLRSAGLQLQRAKAGKASLGFVSLSNEDGKVMIKSSTLIGSPLYQAGLDRGDRILTLGGMAIHEISDWTDVLEKSKIGDTLAIVFEQRGEKKNAKAVLQENSEWEVVPFEYADVPVTNEIVEFRVRWLNSQTRLGLPELKRHCPKCHRVFAFEYEFCPFDGSSLAITPKKK